METYTARGDALRARGNVLYSEVAGGGGDGAAKRAKLQRAQELYKEALELSCDPEQRASCCKNLGALHYLWAKVELARMPSWVDEEGEVAGRGGQAPAPALSAVTQHARKAARFYVRAHIEGARAEKPGEWMEKVGAALTGLVAWAAEQSNILALPGAPILKSIDEELETLGRYDLAFKVEAEALANLELAIYLSNHEPVSNTFINGLPANVEAPLSHARCLINRLPPSSATTTLQRRLSAFDSDNSATNIFEEFFGHAQFQSKVK